MSGIQLSPEEQQRIAAEAQRQQVESMLFSACYGAVKKTAQHMLDQMAKQNVPANMAIEFMHIATEAVAQGFAEMAVEHIKARPADVEAGVKRARALGTKIYRDTWHVMVKTADGGGIVEVSADGGPKGASGLVGPDGKPL
jgi:hypothetical protein